MFRRSITYLQGATMVVIRFIVLLLIIVGALNWGLWGFFQYDLVADIFGGPSSGWSRFIFALVGLAGIYGLSFFGKVCSSCCHKDSCHPENKPGDQNNQQNNQQNQDNNNQQGPQ